MAQPLVTLLRTLLDKTARVAEIQSGLLARIDSLEKENESLRLQLEDTRKELKAAQNDAEFLTMSHRLAQSPDSLISTRRHIARLIRTIDKCISMLKEE